jgi:hypothetical protein
MKSGTYPGRRRHARLLCGLATLGLAVLAAGGATAQEEQSVALVRQDFSDCTNSTVKAGAAPPGTIWLVRNSDNTTAVKIAMTVVPDTIYHFFLKCVRQLGDIKTDDEGIGVAVFSFPTNSVGNVYAFDMYPEGAPAGNKFQSVTVKFP